MTDATSDLRTNVAAAARAFSALNYVHAFGHVSARTGSGLLITPTRPPLGEQNPDDILEADFAGHIVSGASAARPIEIFLHIGIYEARADVGAICRTHAPHASVWSGRSAPPVQHGFGGIAGKIALYDDCDLVHDAERGSQAAKRLGDADALVLRGNGVATVGATLAEAAARMWSLEERFAQSARQRGNECPFSEAELEARGRWYPAEAERVWIWLKSIGSTRSAHGGAR